MIRSALFPDSSVRAAAPASATFASLLSASDWRRLPAATRRRFCRRGAARFVGRNLYTYVSPLGRALAQAARLLGAPLPLGDCDGLASTVSVTTGREPGASVWTRRYRRRDGSTQQIRSVKKLAGPTGLEENLGCGVGMALSLAARGGRLAFVSEYFFLRLCGRRLRLPRWLSPGRLTVTHDDRGGGEFIFEMRIEHRYLGRLIEQRAVYRDVSDDPAARRDDDSTVNHGETAR